MLLLAILFAGLAVLGALVGLEHLGEPFSGQSPIPYGWALCLNAGVIAAFLVYSRFQRSGRSSRPRSS